MNQHFCRILCQALIVTALYGSDYALAAADPEHVSRIAVVFVEPENFADVKRSEFKPNSDALLDALGSDSKQAESPCGGN